MMKKLIRYSYHILAIVLLLFSCEREKFHISDGFKDRIPKNVHLLEYTNSSITVAWDYIEEATSYTVQLITSEDSDFPFQSYTTSTEDYHEFNKLEGAGNYYARVRANFPYSATSEWVYIMNENGRARIIPRYGIVNEDFEIEYIKEIASSSSTATIAWSFTDFQEMDTEFNNKFNVELFNDAACTDLHISWEAPSGLYTASTVGHPRPMRFTFTGLSPGKTYYARVTDMTNDVQSTAKEVTTKVFDVTATTNPSSIGDVVIAEDFAGFIHGGDILYKAAAYTVGSAPGRAQWLPATGNNPIDNTLGQATCNQTVEFNVFDGGNVTPAYTEGAGMKGWGKSGNTSTRPGYIKIGGSGGVGILYTPELSALAGNANITVSFKAAVYSEGSNNFCEDIVVYTVEGASFNAKGSITNESSTTKTGATLVDIREALGDFKEYSVTLTNVSPNSRIAFSSNPEKIGANQTRFLLDEIVIEISQ